jgi:hypothetical protein
MTGAEAAEQAADRAEKATTRPMASRQVESDEDDEDDGIVVPGHHHDWQASRRGVLVLLCP